MRVITKTVLVCLVCLCFISCSRKGYDTRYLKDIHLVATKVKEGDIAVNDDSIIILPEEYQYLSENGEACLVAHGNDVGVYFFEVRGILGNSKGIVYFYEEASSEIRSMATERYSFANLEALDHNVYRCVTDD